MLPFLVFLGIPLLGAILLVAEHSRRHGETQIARRCGRTAVTVLGGVLGILGAFLTLGLVLLLLFGSEDGLWLARGFSAITLTLACVLILYAARNALRVGWTRGSDESVVAQAHQSHDSDELRLSGWMLILAPVLQLGFLGLFFLMPVLLYGVVSWSARRARESHFLWTLALAVENDLPLDDEVEAFSLTLWRRQRRKYRDVATRLREGRSLIDALELSGVLGSPLVAELRAAQAAGTLAQALRKAAATYTSSLLNNRIDASIAVTTVYVWTVFVTVLGVVGFVMYWIIPKFKDIFNDFGVELPAWTMQAITLSDTIMSNFLLVMPLISLPIVAGLVAVIVCVVGWGNLNYPLLMRWFPRWDAPGLLHCLAYTVESGRPLSETLEEMAEHQRRRDLRERLQRIQQAVGLGQPLWTTLASEGLIRTTESQALEAASRAGNLNWALRILAESMQRTSRYRVQFWMEFIKPAFIIAVGCLVGFFVIAFFLPLVRLIGDLS